MSKKQLNLLQLWNRNDGCQSFSRTSTTSSSSSSNLSNSQSLSSPSPPSFTSDHDHERDPESTTSSTVVAKAPIKENQTGFNANSNNSPNLLSNDLRLITIDEVVDGTNNADEKCNNKSDRNYLPDWEKRPAALYKTYVSNESGILCEKLVPWLNFRDNAMYCSLCTRHGKWVNSNGT